MPAPLFDFVSALSAEERCPVCEELHAAVDQRVCGACGAAICPDCASLRPDTSWACSPCQERAPARVFALPGHVQLGALRTAFASLTTPVSALGRPTRTLIDEGLRPIVAASVLTFVATFHALRSRLFECSPRLSALQASAKRRLERTSAALDRHADRVVLSFQRDRDAMSDALSGLLQPLLPGVRLRLAQLVLSIRNVSLREQLAGRLLGVAILISVARTDHRNPH